MASFIIIFFVATTVSIVAFLNLKLVILIPVYVIDKLFNGKICKDVSEFEEFKAELGLNKIADEVLPDKKVPGEPLAKAKWINFSSLPGITDPNISLSDFVASISDPLKKQELIRITDEMREMIYDVKKNKDKYPDNIVNFVTDQFRRRIRRSALNDTAEGEKYRSLMYEYIVMQLKNDYKEYYKNADDILGR